MNRYELNGSLLGNGGNDSRTFVSIAVVAVATVALSATVWRSFPADSVYGIATGAADANVATNHQAESAVTATATGTAAPFVRVAVAAAASGLATGSASAGSTGATFANASVVCRATAVCPAGRGVSVAASASGLATASLTPFENVHFVSITALAEATTGDTYFTESGAVPQDRLMLLPDDARRMEVPA